MFKHKVFRYIEEQALFHASDKILVALSGGADSVALLRVLTGEGYRCVAAHCNFHLRGSESDRDERFVTDLCRQLGVECHVTHFQTEEHARNRGISIEMAARELRYAWFEELRLKVGAGVVAVAHHQDDSVETFLLNLVRGTGINGLKGIAPVNGHVVRPLLCVSRKDILCYLQALHQDYVTDSTNLVDDYTRNKLRLNVLPMLAEINPSVSETIAETARRLSEVDAVYRHAMQEACQRVKEPDGTIIVSRLMAEVAPRAVLFELLRPMGFNASQQKDIFCCVTRGESGKKFLSDAYVLLLDRDRLLARALCAESRREEYVLRSEIIRVPEGRTFEVPRCSSAAFLDARRVEQPLHLRLWQSGDSFVPFGMHTFKKVRDYLRDRKLSLFDKENQRVVCTASGTIVWLVNERTDNRFRVTNSTREVLKIWVEKQ